MKNVIYDIETDGLLDHFTTVHSLVVLDMDTGELLSCTDDPRGRRMGYRPISEGIGALNEAENIYGHNLKRFDHPALRWQYPGLFDPPGRVFDTLVMTRLRWAHVKQGDYKLAAKRQLPSNLIGSQGLEAWGHRFGIAKGDYTDWCEANGIEDPWADWRPEMQRYCEQDTKVNLEIVRRLRGAGMSGQSLAIDLELADYLAQQERNGWPFDLDKAIELQGTLVQEKAELEEELKDAFGAWYVPKEEFTPKVSNSRYGYVEGVPMTKLELKIFNPGSRHHIADRLQKLHGWEPKRFTPSGQPKVDEQALTEIEGVPLADKLHRYLVVDKMLGYVVAGNQAWLDHQTTEGRWGGQMTGVPHIHHSIGRVTVTHRHRHSHPNIGQVPSDRKPYGKEARELFTVPPGWKLVGSDASSLELRCLAHYMAPYDGGEYGEAVLHGDKSEGTDAHSLNAKALGVDRDTAKTWF